MKTNLFRRTLSFVIVACMLIAMVAVAPMASAATPDLNFGLEVTEADGQLKVAVYMTGYDKWNLEETGIDNIQFRILFDTSKVTFVTSAKGTNGVTLPTGATATASGKSNAAAANKSGYVSYTIDAGIGEDEDTGEECPLYIPQAAKVYFRTYTFSINEGATGDCEFKFDTFIQASDFYNGMIKHANGSFPANWTATPATYTIPSAAPEFTVEYIANGGQGTMENTVGTAPVIAANGFTKAGYTFAGWVDAEGNKYEAGATATANLKLIATWTANATTEVASWYTMIGAQARTAESGKSAGMRFGVDFVGLENVVIEEKGILMIPSDLLNGELTHDTADVAIKEFNNAWQEGESQIYTAVLVNIPEGQYARPITARGFVKVNGNYYYTPAIERNYKAVLDTLSAMQ